MATALEYFEKSTLMELGLKFTFSTADRTSYELRAAVVQDFDAGSKYLKVYIPESKEPEYLLAVLLNRSEELIWKQEQGISVEMSYLGTTEKISNLDLRFSGRVIVYTPNFTTSEQWKTIRDEMTQNGLNFLVRDGSYAEARNKHELPLAFISHDSRDKEPFVRELAISLSKILCPVWYDEFKLNPGDSLRESIELGLKNCPKCIVVLSKNFFSNPGWTKREFDTIYTREIIEGNRLMIPIWLDVEKKDIFEYSPILLDTVGIPASLGAEKIAHKIANILIK